MDSGNSFFTNIFWSLNIFSLYWSGQISPLLVYFETYEICIFLALRKLGIAAHSSTHVHHSLKRIIKTTPEYKKFINRVHNDMADHEWHWKSEHFCYIVREYILALPKTKQNKKTPQKSFTYMCPLPWEFASFQKGSRHAHISLSLVHAFKMSSYSFLRRYYSMLINCLTFCLQAELAPSVL